MKVIYIPQLLKASDQKIEITLDESLENIKTLTPIRGTMTIRHGGTFLEIKVNAYTITTLTCDRCLQQYNNRLSLDTTEIIWLDKNSNNFDDLPLEREIHLEDLSESLPIDGHFEAQKWLYEQIYLSLPLRKVCGENCGGVPSLSQEGTPTLIDSRWASLASLKQQLSE